MVRIGVTAVVLVFCYADVLAALVALWTENSRYSYGFAVPLISAYLVWTKWRALRSMPSTPDYVRGGTLVLIGLGMLSVGRLGGLMSVQALSLVITLSALVLFLWGAGVFRAIRFPLAYLLLAMPVWDYLFSSLQLPGQRAAATMATALLHVVGVPALHHGITIDLPNVSLEVMPECSGINQLLALTTMAIPAGYLWIDGRARQASLVLVAIVLGYLSNGLRVAILGWLTWQGYRVSDPHSVIHLAPGFFSVGLAYLVLGACLTWLSKADGKDDRSLMDTPPASPPVSGPRRVGVDFAVLVLMLCAGASQLVAMPEIESPSALAALPIDFPGWQMESSEPHTVRFAGFDEKLLHLYPSPTGERRFAGVDQEVFRTYHNHAGARVHLYVGYYWSQTDDKELSGEVGRALQRIGSPLTVLSGNNTTVVREVVQQRADGRRGVLFWYVVNGHVTSNIYVAKLYTLWAAMTKWRTPGAVVMVAWDGARTDPEDARAAALEFTRALLSQPRLATW
jgi:EpsI family protein